MGKWSKSGAFCMRMEGYYGNLNGYGGSGGGGTGGGG